MRTLHVSKELRNAFSDASRSITRNDYGELEFPKNVGHLVSEKGLRETLKKRLESNFITNETVKYSPDVEDRNTHVALKIKANPEVEAMIIEELASMLSRPKNYVKPLANYWLPPGGYTGWHSSPNFAGWRLYLTYADRPKESFMSWMEGGEVKTSYDSGFDLRMFYAGVDQEFWHCSYAGRAHRVTVGFNLIEGRIR